MSMIWTEEWKRDFYSNPTGYGSQGGYDFLCGLPRALPSWFENDGKVDTSLDAQSYFNGYDRAKELWPTEESRAWFKR